MIDIDIKHATVQFTKKEVQDILAQFNRTLENVQVDIDCIKSWIDTQPHLNRTPDRVLLNLLILNKFSIEKTKTKLDFYYSIRAIVPEVFMNSVPSNKEIIAMKQIGCAKISKDLSCFALPKLVNLNRVFFVVFSKVDFKFNGYRSLAMVVMKVEAMMFSDIHSSLEIVMDYSQTNLFFWSHFTPTMAKILIRLSEKLLSHRLKTVRIIGLPSFAHTLITYGVSLLPQKIKQRVSFHKDAKETAQFYPKEALPVEFGGTGRSYREMCSDFDEMVDRCEEYFQHIQNFKVNEELRPTPLDNDEMLGFYGNFRKLEVD